MSHRIYQQWECNFCCAYFSSQDQLQSHFDEYQSRKAYLSIELEKCRAHANADCDEGGLGNEDDELDTISKNLSCPYEGCIRTTPFGRGQQLRVHFRQHVICEEVCVYCFKVFRRTSEYIRHAREHNDASETKRRYTNQICDELRKLADKQLKALLQKGKKRTWEEAAMDSDTRRYDLQLGGVGVMPDNSHHPTDGVNPLEGLDSANISQITPVLPPAESDTVLMALPDITMPVNFADGPAQSQPSMEVLMPAQGGNDIYDAPLFLHLNFPRYPTSMMAASVDSARGIGM